MNTIFISAEFTSFLAQRASQSSVEDYLRRIEVERMGMVDAAGKRQLASNPQSLISNPVRRAPGTTNR